MSIGFLAFWRAVHVTLWGGDDLFAPPVTLWISRPVAGVPGVTYLVLATFILLWFITTQTRFGRYIYAIGNDEQSAYQAGVPVRRVRTLTYAALGMLVGIASVIFMARTGVIQAFSGQGLELEAIAAAVVGGTAITGGRGRILSTLGGVLFVAFLENGIVLLGIADFWVEFLLGGLILAAVAIDARLKGVDMEDYR
jgi:ribose/xylose/arabinose/galactoside ABC-type transport system permease subunit